MSVPSTLTVWYRTTAEPAWAQSQGAALAVGIALEASSAVMNMKTRWRDEKTGIVVPLCCNGSLVQVDSRARVQPRPEAIRVSRLDKREQVLVQAILVRGGQPVRRALVDLERRVRDDLRG